MGNRTAAAGVETPAQGNPATPATAATTATVAAAPKAVRTYRAPATHDGTPYVG